jgi:hypothetical protein
MDDFAEKLENIRKAESVVGLCWCAGIAISQASRLYQSDRISIEKMEEMHSQINAALLDNELTGRSK